MATQGLLSNRSASVLKWQHFPPKCLTLKSMNAAKKKWGGGRHLQFKTGISEPEEILHL